MTSSDIGNARTCGECHVCCVGLTIVGEPRIAPGEKPMWEPCRHLAPSPTGSCGIYPKRPRLCQTWRCLWRTGWGDDGWRPDRCNVLAFHDRDTYVVLQLVDTPAADDSALAAALAIEEGGDRVRLHCRRDYPTLAERLTRERCHLLEWLIWLHDARASSVDA